MKTVVVDTNVLMLFGECDIFTEIHRTMREPYVLAVISSTINELDKLMVQGTGREKRTARLVQEALKKKGAVIIPVHEERTDDALVSLSRNGDIIATQDKALKKRLEGEILVPRGKRYFVLIHSKAGEKR